jgi:hypothetical protein
MDGDLRAAIVGAHEVHTVETLGALTFGVASLTRGGQLGALVGAPQGGEQGNREQESTHGPSVPDHSTSFSVIVSYTMLAALGYAP